LDGDTFAAGDKRAEHRLRGADVEDSRNQPRFECFWPSRFVGSL